MRKEVGKEVGKEVREEGTKKASKGLRKEASSEAGKEVYVCKYLCRKASPGCWIRRALFLFVRFTKIGDALAANVCAASISVSVTGFSPVNPEENPVFYYLAGNPPVNHR
ncbi:hypothetical protein [Paenibacillus agri]|uniref:Uncharacterized protein n=1 Tax=Paenibacillus agri TaxID=2744309 RepID=A0A850EPI9_9BACL|nr:hypothetical protein [Paenibacillus agri]NUU61669.1 hypothetical protein [Paenibacillus agri]